METKQAIDETQVEGDELETTQEGLAEEGSEEVESDQAEEEVVDTSDEDETEEEDSNKAKRIVIATFTALRARLQGFTYRAKDHTHRVVLDIPADACHSTAMLKMHDEFLRLQLTYEAFEGPAGTDDADPEQPMLPFSSNGSSDNGAAVADGEEAEDSLDDEITSPGDSDDEAGEPEEAAAVDSVAEKSTNGESE